MIYSSCFLFIVFVFSIMSTVTTLLDENNENDSTMNFADTNRQQNDRKKDCNSLAIRSLPANGRELASKASPGVSYHEFLINEASYKFWAIFQLVTVAVLLYSTFAAIYYARYNYLMNLESGNYDDLLFARSSPAAAFRRASFPALDTQTFQRIVDAIF